MTATEKKQFRQQFKQTAMRVSAVSVVVNLLLSGLKFLTGVAAHSGAMISDGVHSASDVLSTVVVMIGVNIANKEKDAEHPYGHDRMESVAALALAAVLMVTGALIGWRGVQKMLDVRTVATPGMLAMAAAIVSIGVKEWLYWYTIRAAKRIRSGALKADAWHHRSDALSSIGALIGIAGARMGVPILEPIAQVVIALMVLKVAFDIAKDSVDRMIDRSVDQKTLDSIYRVVVHHPGVIRVDDLRSRTFGAGFYIDLEIAVDAQLNLQDAHAIAESLHDQLENQYPMLKHCMVHVNPAEAAEISRK
ncbi:cation diffusion facilitator family transporter [Pseudoramibacter faecis]|uniref:cation diffusion facilitator family transporter n=1 Tax=Pseudoramibacter faecis TaxID=3108534 RepID=UPI002E7912B5|nr:cation diffusion facilitator family transporter [Pseudoramibacter sp. HA2172]